MHSKQVLASLLPSGACEYGPAFASYPPHVDHLFLDGRNIIMLSWALTFFIVALTAGVLGLSGVAGVATEIAWVLFVVFLILFVVSFVSGRRLPPPA